MFRPGDPVPWGIVNGSLLVSRSCVDGLPVEAAPPSPPTRQYPCPFLRGHKSKSFLNVMTRLPILRRRDSPFALKNELRGLLVDVDVGCVLLDGRVKKLLAPSRRLFDTPSSNGLRPTPQDLFSILAGVTWSRVVMNDSQPVGSLLLSEGVFSVPGLPPLDVPRSAQALYSEDSLFRFETLPGF